MKTEIATEFGISLDPETIAHQNGSVGGELTKHLVTQALEKNY